jgi:outer membrane lipoprotein-sorting protein
MGLVVCACASMMPSCRGSQTPRNSNIGSADTGKATFTTPPFTTKEPDRYQAIRITTFTGTGSSGSSTSSQSNQVFIARDGERRREEYFAGTSSQIVYLEVPEGRFIVLPANRLYAETSTSSPADQGNGTYEVPDDLSGLSPDQLLNEAHAPATYEKLGEEIVAGRTTIKYRVVVLTGASSQNETLIWVDEGLGMPVRSESESKSSGHSSKVTMELKDVKLEVDERLFSWPSDYRKAEARVLLELIRRGKPANPQ